MLNLGNRSWLRSIAIIYRHTEIRYYVKLNQLKNKIIGKGENKFRKSARVILYRTFK